MANQDTKAIQEQAQALAEGTMQVLPAEGLVNKLQCKPVLRVKLGFDPTAPDLHLGHVVVLAKLKQFQQFGHHVDILIGDFTAAIGDPTGRSKTRPPLTKEQITHNMHTYLDQVGRILDLDKVTVRYNSEWLGSMTSADIVALCSKMTLAHLLEREDFAKRLQEHQPIAVHEILYPMFQAYDSVVIDADVEIGGSDQTLNILLGRDLQHAFGKEQQVAVTMPLLEGLDGVAKMSKSLGNAIGLNESAQQAFGKLMSISDTLMWRYLELLLNVSSSEISQLQERVASGNTHPMALKKQMAQDIVARYWSAEQARTAREQFEQLFEERDMQAAPTAALDIQEKSAVWIVTLLQELGVADSSSQIRRLLEAGAVSVDGQKITDFKQEIVVVSGMIVKVGKHKVFKIDCQL